MERIYLYNLPSQFALISILLPLTHHILSMKQKYIFNENDVMRVQYFDFNRTDRHERGKPQQTGRRTGNSAADIPLQQQDVQDTHIVLLRADLLTSYHAAA